jgi:hypothetical protein
MTCRCKAPTAAHRDAARRRAPMDLGDIAVADLAERNRGGDAHLHEAAQHSTPTGGARVAPVDELRRGAGPHAPDHRPAVLGHPHIGHVRPRRGRGLPARWPLALVVDPPRHGRKCGPGRQWLSCETRHRLFSSRNWESNSMIQHSCGTAERPHLRRMAVAVGLPVVPPIREWQ